MVLNEVDLSTAKKITIEDLNHLSDQEVIPEDIYQTGKPKRISPKNCFKKAFEYMNTKSNLEGIKLAHGYYKPASHPMHSWHAWVELPNDIVFDGVLQRFYRKNDYYSYYQIDKTNEYTYQQMWEAGKKNGGTYGPWEE